MSDTFRGGCVVLSLWCLLACETPSEREARELAEKSRRQLAHLLEVRECTGCYIVEAELSGLKLSGIRVSDSYLHGNLRNADLRHTRFHDAGIGGDLRGVDLRGASVQELSLHPGPGLLAGARLDDLDLRTIRFPDCTDWSHAILRGVNLEGLRLNGLCGGHGRMEPRHPLEAATGGATMKGVDLRGANLTDARLSMADLRDADLRGATLLRARLPPAENLVGATFQGAIAPDGDVCVEGSIGRCVTQRGAQPPWLDPPRHR